MPHAHSGRKPRRQWAPDARALSVVGDRWLMVIVRDLASGPLRLETLRRWLPGMSAGALEARLVRMAEDGLLERRRRRSLPPRVDLELTDRGQELVGVIAELARWELQTRWSAPEADEWVDVTACFRLAPFLQRAHDSAPDGTLALTLLDDASAPTDHYAYVRADGRAKLAHCPAPSAEATISGTQEAWVRALSPEGGRDGLRIGGDQEQAKSFLTLFKPAEQ
jgi:DNA-binding HxlR family transcriptional regulator